MINKILNKLCMYYIKSYKRRIKSGIDTTTEEDKIYAYCILELIKEK